MNLIGPICHRDRWGYITDGGVFAIPPQFDGLGEYREDRISFCKNGRLGFLNATGEQVIPPIFEVERYEMPHFNECLCAVRFRGLIGYVDKAGKWIIQPQFQQGWDFRDGKAIVETSEGYAIIDTKGGRLTELQAFLISGLQDWPAIWNCFPVFVRNDQRILTQWLNWSGEVVFGARFCWMTNWTEDTAGFCEHEDRVSQPWGLVRKTGEVVAPPQFFALSEFVDGLARARRAQDDYGFINAAGEWVILPRFQQAQPFSDGLACVTLNGKKGFINTRGEMIIEARFDQEARFRSGFAQVEHEGKHAVIDKQGRVVWETQLEDSTRVF